MRKRSRVFAAALIACALTVLFGIADVRAQAFVFPNTTIDGIIFSGLEMVAQPSARKGRAGDVEYGIRCIASTEQPDVQKTFELIFQVFSKDNRLLRSVGTAPISIDKNSITHCGQGSGPFPYPGSPPDHIAIQIKVTAAKAHRRLELSSGGLPNLNFKDASIDGLIFSGLALVDIRGTDSNKQPTAEFLVSCSVTGEKNRIRTVAELEFFVYQAADSPPFVAVPIGPPVTTTNGVPGDCHQGTGPIPDPGFTPAGMIMQYSEPLALVAKIVKVQPIAAKN
jgi:hypothetical protein